MALFGKEVERIAVVFCGGLSIFCGYKLFWIATEKQGEMNFKLGQHGGVKLKNLAPGIYFAALGTVILIYSLLNPSDWSRDITKLSGTASGKKVADRIEPPEDSNKAHLRTYIRVVEGLQACCGHARSAIQRLSPNRASLRNPRGIESEWHREG